MDSSLLNILKGKLDNIKELGPEDLKECVDKIPFFVVCQQCGRSRSIEVPVCNHCENQTGNAIGFFVTEG